MPEDQVERTVGTNTTAKAFPNWKSYVMSSRGWATNSTRSPTTLQRARLYSVTSSQGSASAALGIDLPAVAGSLGLGSLIDAADRAAGRVIGAPEIVTTLFKEFQFNPPELQMSINMAPTDGQDTINPGGNAQGGSIIGMASTAVEMLFDRTQETHDGQRSGSRFDEYARLGVAKDILDVYAVVKGDRAMLEAGVDKKSLSELTKEMTDLVARGSEILMGYRVALAYSRDFILYGIVKDMNFRFVKFNHMLVPTMGYVNLNIDIHNAGNTALIRNQMAPPSSTGGGTLSLPGAVPSGRPPINGYGGWGANRPI